jgi:hypothetical protein
MLRRCCLPLGLVAAMILSAGGCRSCSTPHDYDPPVANCQCNACGVHRAGSASGGYVEPGYPVEGYYETEGEVVEEPSGTQAGRTWHWPY